MSAAINRSPNTWHDLLPLSALAIGMLSLRLFHFTHPGEYYVGPRFLFLAWNLFLAWVPLLLLSFLRTNLLNRWLTLPIILLWLLFFPNAPYLITDLVHLRPRTGVPLWYDAFLLFTYALLGLLLAVRSLQGMRDYLQRQFSLLAARIFIIFTVLLSGLGVYLGRVERWNSWDVFSNPWGPINDTLSLLMHPSAHEQAWLMIIVMTGLVASCSWWGMERERSQH